jgi:hypothetical protein
MADCLITRVEIHLQPHCLRPKLHFSSFIFCFLKLSIPHDLLRTQYQICSPCMRALGSHGSSSSGAPTQFERTDHASHHPPLALR